MGGGFFKGATLVKRRAFGGAGCSGRGVVGVMWIGVRATVGKRRARSLNGVAHFLRGNRRYRTQTTRYVTVTGPRSTGKRRKDREGLLNYRNYGV